MHAQRSLTTDMERKKIAFVTGANRGIGLGVVEKLATDSNVTGECDVFLTARNVKLGTDACERLKSKGLSVKFRKLDITNVDDRKQFLDFVKQNYPDGIQIAVNNAAINFEESQPHIQHKHEEEARPVVYTNFTCTVDFTLEFLPLLSQYARVVQVSSKDGHSALKQIDDVLYSKFTSESLTLDDLRKLMEEYTKYSEAGEHTKHGWPSWSYAVSKLGLTKASYIIGNMIRDDPRKIIMNACCPGYVDTDMTAHRGHKTVEEGADTPYYLATLPRDVSNPINQFVSEREVLAWSKKTRIHY